MDGFSIITTTIKTAFGDVSVTYKVNTNGAMKFDFTKNNYWDVIWKGAGKTLAEAVYKAVKSINNDYLSGRTIGGINTELQLHWSAYIVGIAKENAKIADIGGIDKNKTDYDSNAWFFESSNSAKIAAKIMANPWGLSSLLNDILRYLE